MHLERERFPYPRFGATRAFVGALRRQALRPARRHRKTSVSALPTGESTQEQTGTCRPQHLAQVHGKSPAHLARRAVDPQHPRPVVYLLRPCLQSPGGVNFLLPNGVAGYHLAPNVWLRILLRVQFQHLHHGVDQRATFPAILGPFPVAPSLQGHHSRRAVFPRFRRGLAEQSCQPRRTAPPGAPAQTRPATISRVSPASPACWVRG